MSNGSGRRPTLAVVGATGVVGTEAVALLEERGFPVGSLRLMASGRSAGETIGFRGKDVTIEALAGADFAGIDLIFSAPGASVSLEYVPRAVAAGALVIDKSSAFRMAPDVPLVTLSALSGRGIDRLREAVVEIYAIWNKRIATHRLNEWLNSATQRHAPPTAKGRRIKIRFMTQPSTRPPTFVAFCSQPTGLPKSYMRYLTNSLREAFQLPGVPIRINLRKGDNPFARD